MWWMWFWLVGPVFVIGAFITFMTLGVGFGANSMADVELEDATLKCFHCGHETSVGRKLCEYCGKELQS